MIYLFNQKKEILQTMNELQNQFNLNEPESPKFGQSPKERNLLTRKMINRLGMTMRMRLDSQTQQYKFSMNFINSKVQILEQTSWRSRRINEKYCK